MTPQEKAKELIEKYCNYVSAWTSTNKPHEPHSAQYEGAKMKLGRAKQCALIAVEEILNTIDRPYYSAPDSEIKYWQDVKEAIEKM